MTSSYSWVHVDGDALRGIREGLDLTQRRFARRVGVSHSLVSKVEAGTMRVSVGTLAQLATGISREFGAEVDEVEAFLLGKGGATLRLMPIIDST